MLFNDISFANFFSNHLPQLSYLIFTYLRLLSIVILLFN
jgi:hypothetical protein